MPRDEGDLSADCSDFARRSRDSIHTARHDTDRTVFSCLAGGVNWALHDAFIGQARQRRDLIGCSETIGRLVLGQFVRTL